MKIVSILMSLCLFFSVPACSLEPQIIAAESCVKVPETIKYEAGDGLMITADLYMTQNKQAPFIILSHQSGSSRGEYLEIAPKLNELGFNCMAIDQRGGLLRNDVFNQTRMAADEAGFNRWFVSVYTDMVASLEYAINEIKAEEIILWSSEYSSTHAFVLGSEYPEHISGILAFSPGEYFNIFGKSIYDYAQYINCPVFITSENTDSDAEMARALFDSLQVDEKTLFLPEGVKGFYGSSVLLSDYKDSELYWDQVKGYLSQFVKIPNPETVTFNSSDDLPITADLHMTLNEKNPLIILLHQSESSRGEYASIAPKLNLLGFNCMAVDLRTGYYRNGKINKTAALADEILGHNVWNDYAGAYIDAAASVEYAKTVLKADEIIIWGSSYSASLALVLGSKFSNDIAGIVAFSPGEYFEFDGKKIEDYMVSITAPTFITSEAIASYVSGAEHLYNCIPVETKTLFQPEGDVKGFHGASVLLDDCHDSEVYWGKVIDFLDRFEVEKAAKKTVDLKHVNPMRDVTLNLSARKITDLSKIEIPLTTEILILNNNKIDDLSPLAKLTNLRELHLDNNQISDLSPLEGLTNLTFIRLDQNDIADLKPLANLTKLTELHLYENNINDIGPLKNLVELTVLYLDDNQIKDISALSGLLKLEILDLSYNHITDWSPVSHLPNVDGRPESN